MNTTKILGEAVGIQRQDIIDRTEEQTAEGLTGAVIIGRFKRGRVDAPMEIHQGNIRGQLGYDPKNPDYIAVQDCLDTDVPSVHVLRVKGQDREINCAGAKSWVRFNSLDNGYDIKLNGKLYITDGNLPDFIMNNLDAALGCNADGFCEIANNSYSDYQRIELIPIRPLQDMDLVQIDIGPNITPVHIDNITGHITFCLSPQAPV